MSFAEPEQITAPLNLADHEGRVLRFLTEVRRPFWQGNYSMCFNRYNALYRKGVVYLSLNDDASYLIGEGLSWEGPGQPLAIEASGSVSDAFRFPVRSCEELVYEPGLILSNNLNFLLSLQGEGEVVQAVDFKKKRIYRVIERTDERSFNRSVVFLKPCGKGREVEIQYSSGSVGKGYFTGAVSSGLKIPDLSNAPQGGTSFTVFLSHADEITDITDHLDEHPFCKLKAGD